jgi:hypothetical protein
MQIEKRFFSKKSSYHGSNVRKSKKSRRAMISKVYKHAIIWTTTREQRKQSRDKNVASKIEG